MEDDGKSKFIPLAFYDGDSELDIGHVKINSSLDYKTFQAILSQKIGISPNQMSIYLVDRKETKLLHQDQNKILITGRASFRLILRKKDCAVLVVLKRSRRDRRRRSKLGNADSSYYFNGNHFTPEPEKFILLRRNVPGYINPQISRSISPYYNQFALPEFGDFSKRFRNLGIRTDEYMPMVSEPTLYNFPVIEEPYLVYEGVTNYTFCEECVNAKRQGSVIPFHLCVNDAVTVSFRSPAGPIARPASYSP